MPASCVSSVGEWVLKSTASADWATRLNLALVFHFLMYCSRTAGRGRGGEGRGGGGEREGRGGEGREGIEVRTPADVQWVEGRNM